MHPDSKKRRSFLALLFAAGDLQRSRWPKAATANRAIQERAGREHLY